MIGAFAFTMSVPHIIIGCGIGVVIVRQPTMSNTETVKKYHYLKNGAMYSIFFLGTIIILDSFGVHISPYVSPLITVVTVGFIYWKSVGKSPVIKKWRKEPDQLTMLPGG